MTSFVHSNGLEDVVDLVTEGRFDMFFIEKDLIAAKEDYQQAENAGVDLSEVKWFTKEEMKEVCRSNSAFKKQAHLL